DAWVVIASNAGSDHAPGWYHNLVADPHATVEIGPRRWPVVAEIADGPTKVRLWPGVRRLSAVYDAYRARTTRDIPVVRLHPAVPAQRVSFGTSGHRGSALDTSFNEDHILAVTQAIVEYRAQAGISGPLYLGKDTHALSAPAERTALEVLAAHGVTVLPAVGD